MLFFGKHYCSITELYTLAQEVHACKHAQPCIDHLMLPTNTKIACRLQKQARHFVTLGKQRKTITDQARALASPSTGRCSHLRMRDQLTDVINCLDHGQ